MINSKIVNHFTEAFNNASSFLFSFIKCKIIFVKLGYRYVMNLFGRCKNLDYSKY